MSTFFTFKINNENFAINVEFILNIKGKIKINNIPNNPDYIKGITEFQGESLFVTDLKKLLKLPEGDYQNALILELHNENNDKVAALFDEPGDVIEIEDNKIKDSSQIKNHIDIDIIDGIIEHNNEFHMILNIKKLFE